jgi:general secretion pathway protein D
MKKSLSMLLALCVSGLLFSAAAQGAPGGNPDGNNAPNGMSQPPGPPPGGEMGPDAGGPPPETEAAPAKTAVRSAAVSAPMVILPRQTNAAPVESVQTNFLPPAQPLGTNADELRLNFLNAPLDEVLHYLSDAAGFIIVLDTRVSGNVSVISSHPMTRDEAVNLLNAELNKNGYAAIRDGRTLTILNKHDAKTRNIPVKTGGDPDSIPNNDEIVTQIIPVRFVDARQLASDLSAFVSPQATVVANEAGNSIVITDTQSNIRHLAEIIRAVDNSAETETEIRVFHLKYASPTDVASELGSVFPGGTSGGGTQAPIRFGGGGPGGFFARMMAANGNASSTSTSDRIKKETQVTAVADARIQAVIVTAPKDLMEQIASMMKDLDVPSERDQNVYVFKMNNGDPQQVATVLQNMFSNGSTSRGGGTSTSQNSALQQRAQNTTTSMGSTTTTSGTGGSTYGGGGGGGGRQF